MKQLLLFSFLLLLATACGKQRDEPTPAPPIAPPPTPSIDFGAAEGYTSKDARNVATGASDSTDWALDATWNELEKKLFASYDLSFEGSLLAANAWRPAVYPNPVSLAASNRFTVTVDRSNPPAVDPAQVRMAYVIVDAHYNRLGWGDLNSVNRQFGAITKYHSDYYSANALYRAYYAIYDEATRQVYYKGHGDIKVVE